MRRTSSDELWETDFGFGDTGRAGVRVTVKTRVEVNDGYCQG